MNYPFIRARRLRKNETIRAMVRDVNLLPVAFVMPVFVCEGKKVKREVSSMPGIFQFSLDTFLREIEEIKDKGVRSVLLFGIPSEKDEKGTQAYIQEGIIQRAVGALKKKFPDVLVITDVCLCEYTSHGHCGLLNKHCDVDNDATLNLLAKTALSQAEAGADIVAPSSMMDGQVSAVRKGLDKHGLCDIPIMAYSAKYASSFYGPFRDAACSSPQSGDRHSYQMDVSVTWEALKEIELDLKEGADIIMVKPALCYLDIIRRAKDMFYGPLAAYNVSGEYAMIKAAGQKGWIDEKKVVKETLIAIKRAGADIIITYFAKEAAGWMKEGSW